MIELPECYVLSDQIGQTIVGKTILNVTANANPHSFAGYVGDPAGYQDLLSGKQVTGSSPGTGYTCGGNTEIRCGDMLLVISTPIKYHAPGDKLPAKHQLLIEFDDSSYMSCTVQMWGSMLCYQIGEAGGLPKYAAYEKKPDPLTGAFDETYFDSLWGGVKPSYSAKAFLATEQRIPGLGNGVLQDILFNAKINPKRKLSQLADGDKGILYGCVKNTLAAMAAQGGRDTERDLFGCKGGYKTILSANTVKSPCPVCGGPIMREAYLGGNIYYCPTCQPM